MSRLRGRAVRLVPVLLLVTFATFSMVRLLPGDPARAFLGPEAPEQQVRKVRAELRLDEPLPVAYVKWLGDVARGDLGESYRTDRPVVSTLKLRLPVSIELMILAQLFGLLLAIPLGVYTAYRAGGVLDRVWSATAFAIIAVPGFVLGLLLIFVFPVTLGVGQISGFTRLGDSISRNLQSLVLPTVTLGIVQVAIYSRILRGDMIATLQEDFVAMARGKGLSTSRVLLRHALRPSSFSLLTLAGVNVGQLIGGAVVVETLFGLPGVGLLVVDATLARDIFVLQGAILTIVVMYVAVNFLVDVLYTVLDPRIGRAPVAA